MRRSAAALVCAALVVAGAAGGCAAQRGAATTVPAGQQGAGLEDVDLGLDFDRAVVPGDVVPGAVNAGTAAVTIHVATAGGGRLTWAQGRTRGMAVRTPSYAPDGAVPAAALVVWPGPGSPGAPDPLDPGADPVEISVDLRADPAAAGRPGDDGDNLVQRGRFGETAQIKIQLDHDVPSCRMAGSLGAVVVTADRPVTPDRWYRLSCLRSGAAVRLRLVDLEGDAPPQDWVVARDPGTIALAGVPLSIAAKVGESGRIDPDSVDQFHGTIDRVVVDVR